MPIFISITMLIDVTINMETRNNVEYLGKFEFNVDKYEKVVQCNNGFLLVPLSDNRLQIS